VKGILPFVCIAERNGDKMKNSVAVASLLTLFITVFTLAQSGGTFVIQKSVIAGGGGRSTGDVFLLDGTIAESLAGATSTGGNFSLGSGFWGGGTVPPPTPTPTPQGLEGDVASRPNGDGFLLSNDVAVIRQMVVGVITPDPGTNEFQRADCAPRATSGDGILSSGDTIQTRRYVAGLDPQQPAGGPMAPALPNFGGDRPDSGNSYEDTKPRTLRVVSANVTPGGKATVSIEMTGRGDELAASFTLQFDPTKLSGPRVELGPDVSPGTVLTVNTGSAAKGTLAILLDSNEPVNRSTWTPKLVTITFDVAQSAQAGPTSLTFSDTVARRSMSDADGNSILSNFEDGVLNISPISR
jgi:hypothetical protein